MSEYPSDEELDKIRIWETIDALKFSALMEYIKPLWVYGWWEQKGNIYYISTGGWSGNEDIVTALQENQLFWMLYWQQSKRGGHYIFGNIHDCLDLP